MTSRNSKQCTVFRIPIGYSLHLFPPSPSLFLHYRAWENEGKVRFEMLLYKQVIPHIPCGVTLLSALLSDILPQWKAVSGCTHDSLCGSFPSPVQTVLRHSYKYFYNEGDRRIHPLIGVLRRDAPQFPLHHPTTIRRFKWFIEIIPQGNQYASSYFDKSGFSVSHFGSHSPLLLTQ